MRLRLLFAPGIALLASGCIDLSTISTNELWIVNDSAGAVSGIACINSDPCFDYQLPAGKFVRTGRTLCTGGANRIGISVETNGALDAPLLFLETAAGCEGLSAIRIADDGTGRVIVYIDNEYSASELRNQ